ncbi:AAA family ATPase [Yinghuangia soli]|uniref:Orc1-like AAA ATPase domain-containing protein n=1 Tax=Yinghuangia soli TaxID=2908204 RepID=A0AA41Q7C9_9ACTN|nr:AAA family ATPase [Yinghuangia soli]MCF2532868.1 hypothetical protein [Yinghuangia soli]
MMYGRAEEAAVVARLLDDARAGRSGTLVVRGEAGIGKSLFLDRIGGLPERQRGRA